jgi:serine/threonine protein kinase
MCMDLASGGELREVISKAVEANVRKGINDAACDLATTRFYIGELIEALEYLHQLHVVHMDIKPESTYGLKYSTMLVMGWYASDVLVTSAGHIKIADFGTALRHPETAEVGSIFVGTAEYVSPEILNADCDDSTLEDFEGDVDGEERLRNSSGSERNRGSQHHNKITRACDIWAVGCICYQMLCGRTPFGADTEYLIFMNINEHLDGTRPIEFPPCIEVE